MSVIDKTSFVNTFGIDDDEFISYLNITTTFKNLIKLNNTNIIPINKLKELYNTFIYYKSIGYDLSTINSNINNKIRKLFFDKEIICGKLSQATNKITTNNSKIIINGRVCQILLNFTNTLQINENEVLFENIPSPYGVDDDYFIDVFYDTNISARKLKIGSDNIKCLGSVIPANNTIKASVTYIISIY